MRYGYQRVHVLFWREDDPKDLQRVGLRLRNKHPKRRVKAKLRDDRQEALGPNDVWARDFVHDQLAMGKKLARHCS